VVVRQEAQCDRARRPDAAAELAWSHGIALLKRELGGG
jgi:hypothetical protein